MLQQFSSFISAVQDVVWGPIMLTILVGTGVFLTLRTKLLCWRSLPHAIGFTLSKEAREAQGDGDVSPFASLCTALAATIGTGNIAGVASAIASGGPGALVWMWISAAFGISSKFVECTLAVKYRITNDKGEMLGGPMVAAEYGIPKVYGDGFKGLGKVLGVLFAFFAVCASFGIGNLTQGNSIATAFNNVSGVPPMVVAVVVGIAVFAIVLGGIQSISKVSSLVVPFMAVFYFVGGLIIILCNVTALPGALVDMFRMAFSVRAVGGGVAGTVVASMFQAMSKGVARGCFSNEAGMGSAAIAAAGATTDNYIRQGLISETGTFWDTMVVCSVTGLAILTSGVTHDITFNADGSPALTGASLTIAAFRSVLGPAGGWLVAIALALFAFSTILGWEYYGEKALEYLTSSTKATLVYRVLFSVIAFVGCISAFELAWNVSDVLNALMIVPNCIIMWMLGGTLVKEFETFLKEHKESL